MYGSLPPLRGSSSILYDTTAEKFAAFTYPLREHLQKAFSTLKKNAEFAKSFDYARASTDHRYAIGADA